MKSLFFKNFIVTVLLFTVCFSVFAMAVGLVSRGILLNEKVDSLASIAGEVERSAAAFDDQSGLNGWELRMSITSLSNSTDCSIYLCDRSGTVVSCSGLDPVNPYIGRRLPDALMTALLTGSRYSARTDLGGFFDKPCFLLAQDLSDAKGNRLGYVLVTVDIDGVSEMLQGLTPSFLLVAMLVLAAAVVITLFFSRRLARPLREMAGVAHRFAKGDYSARVAPTHSQDEVGELTEAFNLMADSIERNDARRSEFIANVSHELRTPMTAISGFADGILDGTIDREHQDEYLRIISSETKRLARLVSGMLDMSRLQSGAAELTMTVFDLSELVLETLLSFEARVEGKGLEVVPTLPDRAVRVSADKDAITRVVYNLLDNALKFAREGSALCVSVWKQDGRAWVSVRDTGPTIPPEELPLIFDRFHKADRSRGLDREGAGLGLYMVRAILDAHKQDIFVTSADEVTTFTFSLQLADS